MAYEQYCAACTYMGESVDCGKYYCPRKGDWLYATTPKCSSFCEAYGRSNYARENMISTSQSAQSSGCYITTMLCDKLGCHDDNYYLQQLRKLRNQMQKNVTDLPLLVMYDQVGPRIAKAIETDEFGDKISYSMFNHYIIPAVTALENEDLNLAKDIYIAMTYGLAEHYNIDTNIVIPNKEEIIEEELGHGKMRIRKPQTNY